MNITRGTLSVYYKYTDLCLGNIILLGEQPLDPKFSVSQLLAEELATTKHDNLSPNIIVETKRAVLD
jgi:hypothetical protein